jgi:hypothetical protein
VNNSVLWGGYDMQNGAYFLNMASNETAQAVEILAPIPRSFFSAESLSSEGAR